MKARALGSLIELVASLTSDKSKSTVALASIFRASPPTATTAALVKKIQAQISGAPISDGDDRLEKSRATLARVQEIATLSSSASVAEVVREFVVTIEANLQKSAGGLLTLMSSGARTPRAPRPPNKEAIERHASELLRRAPGTPAFGSALDALYADATVKLPEMKGIATRLGVAHTESTKRAALFKSIANEHRAASDAAAKAAALKGNNSA